MDERQKAERLRQLFNCLLTILQREHEANWIRAIHLIVDQLNAADGMGKQELDATLQYVKDTYNSINKGMGSFSDFHIWRDDFEERRHLNQELAEILDEIWALLF